MYLPGELTWKLPVRQTIRNSQAPRTVGVVSEGWFTVSRSETIDLNGKRIIVVEDDFVIALDMVRVLEALGATILGPALTPFYALQLMGSKERRKLDAAVLDIHLHRTTVFEVADLLQQRGVPFVFVTGQSAEAVPARFSEVQVLPKPVGAETLSACLMSLVRRPLVRPLPKPLPPILEQAEPPATMFARVIARVLGGTDTPASIDPQMEAPVSPVELEEVFLSPPSATSLEPPHP